MKLAVVTDSTAYLSQKTYQQDCLFVLDVPVMIGQTTYVEHKNLEQDQFYQLMAASSDLPKTSQPSLAELDELLSNLESSGYTHVIGLFLAGGISGFHQTIQFLIDEHPRLTIAFPDSKLTSVPLGQMVEKVLDNSRAGLDFETIMERLQVQIDRSTAFIMVDDLNHLVKGGRLSNGSAILGNLLSIKPILRFDEDGKIVVYEKVRTEKKAIKRLIEILKEITADGSYQVAVLHTNAEDKAEQFKQLLLAETDLSEDYLTVAPLNCVIATHLGEGAVAFGLSPLV
ncbi:DegV family protein [Streptococcus caprae]|uniref:DegV family protein n=1 Tax=Streptococcus caprae TaxID=1640501 RepID=A0ABV8CYB8_9STRE